MLSPTCMHLRCFLYTSRVAVGGILHKVKIGRSNFYINVRLFRILTDAAPLPSPMKGGAASVA